MIKILKKTVAGIIILVLALFLWLAFQRGMGDPFPTFMGYGYAKVASGSMEPAIHVGEFVIVDTRTSTQEGDVIMYLDSRNRLITHRIIAMGSEQLITQGDANKTADSPIAYNQVIGKIIGHFHWPIDALKSHPFMYIICQTGVLLVAAWIIRWSFIEIFLKKVTNKANFLPTNILC